MKYFVAALFLFFIARPAMAAHIVPGTVPHLQSMQPMQAGIDPNPQNIEYRAPNERATTTAGAAAGSVQPSVNTPGSAALNPAAAVVATGQTVQRFWLAVIIALVAAGGVLWAVYRISHDK